MQNLNFLPALSLDLDHAPRMVPIKGAVPEKRYPFALKDIYAIVPSHDVLSACRLILYEFEKTNKHLHEKLMLQSRKAFPSAQSMGEAMAILTALFDPTCHLTDGLWIQKPVNPCDRDHLFDITTPLPFPLEKASKAKLLHTLVWIDTNIKLAVERVARNVSLPQETVILIVESALKIYCVLVKQQDYWLARSMNFNHSMFLQDRILNLLLGDTLFLGSTKQDTAGKLSNEIALQLLQELGYRSLRQLCVGSIFMGTVWTSTADIQETYRRSREQGLALIGAQLDARTRELAVNHLDFLLKDIETCKNPELVVVLDDNGESVFDLALFQQLAREFENLQLRIVTNRFPVSNNIAIEGLQTLLAHSHFAELKRFLEVKRVRLIVEEQSFRSFETSYLCPETRQALEAATCLYIKGANFFETFHVPGKIRYHAFTVYGEMARVLTGFAEGSGIMVRLPATSPAFVYKDSQQITTLRDLIEAQQQRLPYA